MNSIKVDLSAPGALRQRQAQGLNVSGPTTPTGPSFQATTHAVHTVETLADRAERAISLRLRVTGHTESVSHNQLAAT